MRVLDGFAIAARANVRDYANAREFLKKSAISDAGCLVIDYNLPEMNGLDMLDHLRDRDLGVPAILITSCPNAIVRGRAAEAGVPIVEKPRLGKCAGAKHPGRLGAVSVAYRQPVRIAEIQKNRPPESRGQRPSPWPQLTGRLDPAPQLMVLA